MAADKPSLQDGIDRAGSTMKLLWAQNPPPWLPKNIEPEYAGWQAEQAAWHQSVSLGDVSHHMFDLYIDGPDATRLLTAVSANNYENFAVGQAKQFVPVTANGHIITDGILLRRAENEYTLTGIPASQHWVQYHGEADGYDVAFDTDPSSAFRGDADPRIFRYQVQGPQARALVEKVFGGPLPPARFFHSVPVTLDGRPLRALRHNMSGQDGYEFIGDWAEAKAVKEILMLEHAIYSVISPEGCASILWRTADKAADAAEAMKITAADLRGLGVVDRIIEEPLGGAQRDPDAAIRALKEALLEELDGCSNLGPRELRAQRRAKYLAIG